MKYCSGKKKIGCLQAGLVALLVTGYVSAADIKLSPTQQLRSASPGHAVRVPVKVKPPFVPLNAVKQATNKPVKKSAGIKPASSFAVKKKTPGNRGLSPINPINRTINPVAPLARPSVHIPVAPSLPSVPARHASPVAPPVLNPRGKAGNTLTPPQIPGGRKTTGNGGGFGLMPPVMHRPTRPIRPSQPTPPGKGLSIVPSRGFALSPLTRPDTGAAGQGRGAGQRSTGSSPVPRTTPGMSGPGMSGLAPVSVGQSSRSSSPQQGRGFVPPAATTGRPAGEETAGAGSAGGRDSAPQYNAEDDSFVYADGMKVRAHDPDGNMGDPQSDGSISYGNGSSVSHDNDTGSITLHRGGGTTTVYGRNEKHPDRPVYNSENDSYVYPDNTQVKARDPDGNLGRPQADGSIEYSDGTRVTHDNESGDTKFVMGDGTVKVRHGGSEAPPEYNSENDSFVYSDDTQVRARDKNGNMGTPQDDGSIEYSDGTRVTHDSKSGDTKFVMGDGGVQVYHRTGTGGGDAAPQYDGERDAFVFGDGTSVRATGPSGQRGEVGADGTIQYGDGTRVSHDNKSGDTKIVHADGSVTVHAGQASDDDNSSDSDASGDNNSDSNSSDDNNSDDDTDNNSDDNADNNDDNADDNTDSDSDNGDEDSGDDENSSDEARNGFEGSGGSDGGPEAAAKTTVDDRVAHMKGEKRDPESPEDSEPGNGGSAPGSVSQPDPDGGHRASPLARPSAEGHQPLVNVVVPTVKSRSSVGGGDCFRESGCDNAPTGDFRLDPFSRDPVTNPGGP